MERGKERKRGREKEGGEEEGDLGIMPTGGAESGVRKSAICSCTLQRVIDNPIKLWYY